MLVDEDYSQESFESYESETNNNESKDHVLFESALKRNLSEDSIDISILVKSKPKAVDIFKKLGGGSKKTDGDRNIML